MKQFNVCNGCETVSHCAKYGCVPLTMDFQTKSVDNEYKTPQPPVYPSPSKDSLARIFTEVIREFGFKLEVVSNSGKKVTLGFQAPSKNNYRKYEVFNDAAQYLIDFELAQWHAFGASQYLNLNVSSFYDVLRNDKCINDSIVAGALFDFAGMLTSQDDVCTFSGRHEAGPAVEQIQKFADKRGLRISEADVTNWHAALKSRAAPPATKESDLGSAQKFRKPCAGQLHNLVYGYQKYPK